MMTDDPKYTVFEKAPLDKYLDRNVVFYCPNCGYKMQTPYDMSQIKLPDLEVPSIIKNECAFTPNFTIPCPDCKNGYLVDIDAGMVEIIRTLSWDLLDKPIRTTACCAVMFIKWSHHRDKSTCPRPYRNFNSIYPVCSRNESIGYGS